MDLSHEFRFINPINTEQNRSKSIKFFRVVFDLALNMVDIGTRIETTSVETS